MPSARTAVAAALVILVAAAIDARALDMPLAGKKLGMRDGLRARLVLLTRDRISAPAPGLADDPTVAGARLEIGNPDTGEWAAFELPATGWAFDDAGTRFRFREPAPRSDAPGIQRLVLRHRRRLRLRTQGIGMTLDESRQGTIAVVLTMGSRRYCTVFGGIVTYDEPGRFGALDAPAPPACPETVLVSTTTSSTSTTATSSTSSTEASTTTSSSTSSTSEDSTSTSTSSSSPSTAEPTTTSSSTSSTTEASTSTSTSSSSSSTAEPTTTSSSSSSTSSSEAEPTSTSTSSSSSSTAEPTTTSSSSSSTSSTEAEPTSTSTSSSSSSSVEPTTTSSTESTTSSSETSTSTSSTTTSTDFTCGGFPPFGCTGTCPEGQTCGGLFACGCN